MKPDRFTDERAHHPRKATVQGRLYNIQKTIRRKKNTKKQYKKSRRGMVVRRVRVGVQYIRPAPCPFWPPSPPTWIPAVAGTCSLLIISSSFRLAKLLCYSEASVVSFHVSPEFLLFLALPSSFSYFFNQPFFRYMILFSSNFNFSYPDVYLMWSCMYTLLNRIARRDKRT